MYICLKCTMHECVKQLLPCHSFFLLTNGLNTLEIDICYEYTKETCTENMSNSGWNGHNTNINWANTN